MNIYLQEFEALQQAIANFPDNAEEAINDVMHNEAGDVAQEKIKRLMPFSGAHWAGKKPAAKFSKSLQNINHNLGVEITSSRGYGYLYFPDDGTNTRRHVGNQRFFERGAEASTEEIVERCINKLTQILE